MKVILLKDVGGVGKRDTAVDVSDGYALNFLIPRGLAVHASPEKLKGLKEKTHVAAMTAAATDAQSAAAIKKLSGAHVHVTAKANDQRHLYQHLAVETICTAIEQELGITVPPSAVHLKEPIKTLGEWEVTVKLHNHAAKCIVTIAAA